VSPITTPVPAVVAVIVVNDEAPVPPANVKDQAWPVADVDVVEDGFDVIVAAS